MEFVDEVSRNLIPGKSALVAEVDEFWTLWLDLRMEALGGIIIRQWRLDVERDLIENEIQARNAELSQLKAEYAQAEDEHKARLEIRMRGCRGQIESRPGTRKVQGGNAKIASRLEDQGSPKAGCDGKPGN